MVGTESVYLCFLVCSWGRGDVGCWCETLRKIAGSSALCVFILNKDQVATFPTLSGQVLVFMKLKP